MTAGGDAPPATRLLLVRHGESQAIVDQVVGGTLGCRGLTDVGRRQVTALRDRLAAAGGLQVDALYASVLPRAVETAELLAPALGGVTVEQDCDLCELHPGEADGLRWDEFRRRYRGDGVRRWDPYTPMAPGAESWAEFQQRVARRLRQLADDHIGGTVVVACHGGVVDSSLAAFLGLPYAGGLVHLTTRFTSVTEWELEGDQDLSRPLRWRLVRYNDAAHLEPLA